MSTILPAGHTVLWYEIEDVLGQGGFGVTYRAHDPNLDQTVAIKEYFPSMFAHRAPDATVTSARTARPC